jgi:hypothetical protein
MKNKPSSELVQTMFLFLALLALVSCTGKKSPSSAPCTFRQEAESPGDSTGGTGGPVVAAGSIVYDVEILNPYPDDAWTTECLSSLDHKSLVDFVFDGIYSGRFSAYDIFEGTPVSAKKIRKMEKNGEFSRDRIGKFQFQEEWLLDTLNMSFTKKVTEIRMGLQKFNDEGELTGYAPLLRVVL